VSRSGLKHLRRQTVLLIVGALLVLVEAIPASAAGCHVPDRPVLGTRLSWEDDQGLDLRGTQATGVPPVLTHPPCSGEVPHLLGSASGNNGFADVNPARFDSSAPAGSLSILNDVGSVNSLASRLDRPPRARASRVSSL
jgi:hypothetical protein